jgi:membrane fusion protein (multidrug efflux system)
MSDPVIKFPAETKTDRAAPDTSAAPATSRKRLTAAWQRHRRTILLVVLPALALFGGIALYLGGGRYVTTDDAFVGAQKVLITPDISGKIEKVLVREGQHVQPGDELFVIDPVPFRLALQQADASLAQAETTYRNLVSQIEINAQMLALSQQGIELRQRDVERKTTLAKSNYGSQLDLDNATTQVVTARAQLEYLRQQLATARNQLLGNPKLPLEQFPPYAQAKAARDQAQRNLDHTVMRAPISGTATQVDNIQLGRFVPAGTAILSVLDNQKPWVDANLKESDLTYVRVGQSVDLEVDAFPNHRFTGKIGSLSPGTGAQFQILPPQNATGNFVKVVQRVPVRIYFDDGDDAVKQLKAGMSTYVTVDTRHRRSLADLFRGKTSAQDR